MKRIVQVVFLLVSALVLVSSIYFFIQGRSGAAAAARPVATRQVLPESKAPSNAEKALASEEASPINHVPTLPNEVILNVTSFNVDQEKGDEQVLTVRKTDRTDGRLSIVIADYVEQKKSWVRSWEGDTLSTKLTTFSIQAKDLLGDHNLDIICTGMDDSGEQTIAVFRRSTGTFVFSEILSLAADSIAIGEADRSESYQLGQTNGESWPIFAYSGDKESTNLLDQIKDKYAWDPHRGQYVKIGSERIPGAQVEREIISKVLTGSEKDFESFLQGIWYESGKGPFDPGTRLIVFDKASGSISFYKTEAQEVFRWTESHSTRYGLYVRCQNESVENLVRLMDIELTGSDLVSVRVFEDLQMKMDPEDRWDGSFRKLPQGARDAMAGKGSGLSRPTVKLEGPYHSRSGAELNFAQPRYSLKSSTTPNESGGFELYSLSGLTVLELIAVRSDGLPSQRRTYKAVYSETRIGKDLVRHLVLSPAKAAIDGLELLQEDDLVLEQRVKG
ncbi:MAG: pallilysin-related adhesin [Rectinemataceae bacterium]|jgi:hypothetical protein